MQGPRKDNGYSILMAILIFGAIGISVVLSMANLSQSASQTSFTFQQSHNAQELALACAEEAFEQIRANRSFTGAGNLVFINGTCQYNVDDAGSGWRDVQAIGAVQELIRRVELRISASLSTISIASMQEVADFGGGGG